MGLYLTVFDGDDELDGVEVGAYADFAAFRNAVAAHVENGIVGSQCPTLMFHSDCDGQWTPKEAALLRSELAEVTKRFKQLPPETFGGGWKQEVATALSLRPASLYDCFFDVDGEPLLDRLMNLAQLSIERNQPILFQ